MGRLWAFAKEGSPDFNFYCRDKAQWRETLRRALGAKIPSEAETEKFAARLVTRTRTASPASARGESAAKKILLKHISPTDALMAKESVDFGAGAAKYLKISPAERPTAALFIARTREALEKVHKDFPAVDRFEEALGRMEGKRVELKDVYEMTMEHRMKPAARALGGSAFRNQREKLLVFGLCDVPEALWAGERRIAKR